MQAIALDPAYVPPYARLADVFIALGRYDDAIKWLDKGQDIGGGTRRQTDGYGVVYALSGRRAEAEAVVRDLAARARTSDQMAYSVAMVETALGHHDQAIEWLNRGYESRSAHDVPRQCRTEIRRASRRSPLSGVVAPDALPVMKFLPARGTTRWSARGAA